MRSDLDAMSLEESLDRVELLEVQEESPRAKKGTGARARRSNIVAQILVDASRSASAYIERWKAGRGAE